MPAETLDGTTEPFARGPVLDLDGSEVRVGTCSWTDRTLVKETDWYPRRTMSAAERLRFYTRQFPVVEVDSTYYAPPSRQLTRDWVARTPPGFVFDVKAYSLLTHHPTRPQSLWPDLREGVRPEHRDARNLYAEHLEADALDEAWWRFSDGLRPLVEAGRIGAVLMQYPRWFTPKRENREELSRLGERLPDVRVCVELRAPAWLHEDGDREGTVSLMREHRLSLVAVDAPTISGLDRVAIATTEDLAVVRFHGRADDTWNARTTTAAERFRYLYPTSELEEWVEPVRRLADEAHEVHLLMNNCYRDFGVRNAGDLRRLLTDAGAELRD